MRFLGVLLSQLISRSTSSSTSVAPLTLPPLPTAIVTIAIQPDRCGQVRFQGAWWSARCPYPVKIEVEELVYVQGQLNVTTLLVEPILAVTSSALLEPTSS